MCIRDSYMIEGKSYDLKPYDIVLVNHNDIHRLEVDNSVLYERIIVYICLLYTSLHPPIGDVNTAVSGRSCLALSSTRR